MSAGSSRAPNLRGGGADRSESRPDTITIAVRPAGAKTPTRLERLPNDLAKLRKWMERVARDGEVRACYEASGAGRSAMLNIVLEWK